jgi:hypothetical protein
MAPGKSAYLIMICKEIIDRTELETYWDKVGSTVEGCSNTMYLVHDGIQKDQGSDWGLDKGLGGTREPTGLGLHIDFERLYLTHSFGSTECI